jgi:hypothetical protein
VTVINPAYHFGLVVEDLDAARQQIGQVLGVHWAKTQRRLLRQESAAGPVTNEICFTYTLEGPPYLELIEQRPGTVYAELGLHHIAVWSDDPVAESQRLEAHGWPRETVVLADDGTWAGGLYHQGTGSLRIEVVNIGSSGPRLARYLAGGDYLDPE